MRDESAFFLNALICFNRIALTIPHVFSGKLRDLAQLKGIIKHNDWRSVLKKIYRINLNNGLCKLLSWYDND
jgi:hypothetical protein